jgi:hypothetical protein
MTRKTAAPSGKVSVALTQERRKMADELVSPVIEQEELR